MINLSNRQDCRCSWRVLLKKYLLVCQLLLGPGCLFTCVFEFVENFMSLTPDTDTEANVYRRSQHGRCVTRAFMRPCFLLKLYGSVTQTPSLLFLTPVCVCPFVSAGYISC